MNPKVKTAILFVVPLLVLAADRFAPARAPMWIHAVSLVLATALALVNLFHVPASAVDVISTLATAIGKAPTSAAVTAPPVAAAMKLARKIAPLSVLLFVLACNASSQQIGTTISDGVKDGACIAVALLSGSDPLTCSGATEQVVVDVINDVEAPAADAGVPPITAAQREHLEAEKVRMVKRLAMREHGK